MRRKKKKKERRDPVQAEQSPPAPQAALKKKKRDRVEAGRSPPALQSALKKKNRFEPSTPAAATSSDSLDGKYYAVARGHTVGVFTSWDDAELATKGAGDNKFKCFTVKRHGTEGAKASAYEYVEKYRLPR